ncbi:MAG: hypothetical protein II384_00460, partial [Prevotella sp.]|nr:hypothetical protein [Prevotella sp.]
GLPIWAILPTNMGHITNQYGPYCRPIWAILPELRKSKGKRWGQKYAAIILPFAEIVLTSQRKT